MLLVCEALFRTGNAEQAAEMLNVSQPAVSQNLRLLRDLTGDELFVRTPDGLQPTALGRRLAEKAVAVLNEAESILILKDQEFFPAVAQRAFSVGTPSSLSRAVSQGVAALASGEFPNIAWHIYTLGRSEALRLLDESKIDVYVGEPPEALPKFYSVKVIDTVGFKILCSRKSKLAKGKTISREQFLSHPHLRVATSGHADTSWDRMLKANKLRRDVALTLSDYPSAFAAAEKLDCLFVVDEDVYRLYASGHDLRELRPTFKMPASRNALTWHARSNNDAAHVWMRERVESMLAGAGKRNS